MKKGIVIVSALILLFGSLLGLLVARDRLEHKRLLAEYPTGHVDTVKVCASEYSLDPYLVLAVIRCESSFQSDAVSGAGAVGLMQIMPDTGTWIAHKLGMDDVYAPDMLYDPEMNIRFGCWFLRFLTDRFHGERVPILAAYNAGHGRVEKWLADPLYAPDRKLINIPFPETARYVEKVQAAYDAYRSLYPELFSRG